TNPAASNTNPAAANPEASNPAMQPAMMYSEATNAPKLALDECGLKTTWQGDQYCIKPPPADQGFQLHIGPSNYDNPEAQYLLASGQESTPTFSAVSGNDKQIYFYYRQIRMRPGAHHNIITSGAGGDIGLGQRIATSNNL